MKKYRQIVLSLLVVWLLLTGVYAAVPSARPGIGATVYPGGTTFRVWAPNATTVSVTGSFNSWSSTQNPLAGEGSGWWSADVPGATANQQYKYSINGAFLKVDPRANDVVSSVGDGIIVDNSFNWTPFTPPAWNEMVIYEMHIGTFYDVPGGNPGTWQYAALKLNHIESLGVNVVKIMPVAEFPGNFSMGYNPVNLYAPESAYGSPHQMRSFIDQCHQRGIAVIIDVVYNHLGPSDLGNSLWQFDGYSATPDTGGIYFFEDDNRYTPWGDTRPNYTKGEVRSFIRDNVFYWLNDFNADGIRMDGTAYIRERDGGYTVPGGWDLMQWINNDVDAACPQKIVIAEDMRDNEWLTKTTGEGGAGFDSQWDAQFHHKVVPVLEQGQDQDRNMWDIQDAITHSFNGWDTQRVIYTESHDEVGYSSGKWRVPNRINSGDPTGYWSKKRSTLGAGIVFTSPGIPMLFMGQEFLETGQWHDDDPLDWLKDSTFAGIKQLYTDLIELRRNLAGHTRGLTGKNVNVFHVNDTDKVVAFHRWLNGGPGDDVVVVANFSNQGFTSYTIGMPRGGRWRVRFNSDWEGYDPEFDNWNAYDTLASAGAKDGLSYQANVGIGRYSMIILSQGTTPDIDGSGDVNLDDLALFARQWQNSCDPWDSCTGVDFDLSGTVDMTDLAALIARWLDDLP
jgi:1,4-alpha-glucan branching enzyme